jgi:hypothetical protein
MIKKASVFKSYIFNICCFLIINNNANAQIQPWLGIHLISKDNIGISTGIVIKDKFMLKYSYTNLLKYPDNYITYNLKTFSAGWIFTKPYKKIRMGTGLTLFYTNREYELSFGYKKEIIKDNFLSPIPLPFFYIDMILLNRIKVNFNTSIFINEIGIGYRFGKIALKSDTESKIKKTRSKEKMIFH